MNVSGQMYGGSLDAHVRIDWTRQWQVSGDLSLGGVDIASLQRLLGKPVKLSGKVKATTAFSGRAKTADALLDVLTVDGPFEILGGEYKGVDLAKAGDLTTSRGAADATRFDEFKGLLQMRGRQVRINELCVRSPNMVAGGNIEIAEDQKLSGALSVSVANTGGFVGVPVKLSGTVAEPGVSPTTGYTLGAVIGTLILPGIGTGIRLGALRMHVSIVRALCATSVGLDFSSKKNLKPIEAESSHVIAHLPAAAVCTKHRWIRAGSQ